MATLPAIAPTVEVAPEIAKKAVKPIEKMLSLS
jgi:quinolinate synthase